MSIKKYDDPQSPKRNKSFGKKVKKLLKLPLRMMKKIVHGLKQYGFVGTLHQVNIRLREKFVRKRNLRQTKKMIQAQFAKEQLIVSLTSIPSRINTVHLVIDSLLSQSLKPQKIILWLAKEQFPHQEQDLPAKLLARQRRGLEIRWCEDLKSYKKLIPTLALYPDAIICTFDDDNLLQKDCLYALYDSYLQDPSCIHCHRAAKFVLQPDGTFERRRDEYYDFPTFLNSFIGVCGVLYPPHSLSPDVIKQEIFLELAPTNDDVWFWFMAMLNGYPVKQVAGAIRRQHLIPGTQEIALKKINNGENGLLMKQFTNLLKQYPKVKAILLTESAKIDQQDQ